MVNKLTLRNAQFGQIFDKIKTLPTRLVVALNAFLISLSVGIAPTFCNGNIPTGGNMKTLFTAMTDIIFTIAFYVGAIIIVGGVFNWIMAQKDENADSQSRAIKFIIVGFALCCLKVIVSPVINTLGF